METPADLIIFGAVNEHRSSVRMTCTAGFSIHRTRMARVFRVPLLSKIFPVQACTARAQVIPATRVEGNFLPNIRRSYQILSPGAPAVKLSPESVMNTGAQLLAAARSNAASGTAVSSSNLNCPRASQNNFASLLASRVAIILDSDTTTKLARLCGASTHAMPLK